MTSVTLLKLFSILSVSARSAYAASPFTMNVQTTDPSDEVDHAKMQICVFRGFPCCLFKVCILCNVLDTARVQQAVIRIK